jgi:heat shock protein HslJ
MKTILLTILLTLSVAAAQFAPQNPLKGKTWELSKVGSKSVVAANKPAITFAEDRINAYFGCNRGGGSYRFNGVFLRFESLSTTRMLCGEGGMDLERQLLTYLPKVLRYTLNPKGDTLQLVGSSVTLTFKLKE